MQTPNVGRASVGLTLKNPYPTRSSPSPQGVCHPDGVDLTAEAISRPSTEGRPRRWMQAAALVLAGVAGALAFGYAGPAAAHAPTSTVSTPSVHDSAATLTAPPSQQVQSTDVQASPALATGLGEVGLSSTQVDNLPTIPVTVPLGHGVRFAVDGSALVADVGSFEQALPGTTVTNGASSFSVHKTAQDVQISDAGGTVRMTETRQGTSLKIQTAPVPQARFTISHQTDGIHVRSSDGSSNIRIVEDHDKTTIENLRARGTGFVITRDANHTVISDLATHTPDYEMTSTPERTEFHDMRGGDRNFSISESHGGVEIRNDTNPGEFTSYATDGGQGPVIRQGQNNGGTWATQTFTVAHL